MAVKKTQGDLPEAPRFPALEALEDKQQAFVRCFVAEAHFNASEAARMAGYLDGQQSGWRLKNTPAVRAAIKEQLDAQAMSAEEVLQRLADQASSSVSDFLKVNGRTKPDLKKAEAAGKLHLIKKISFHERGGVKSIELHDAQAALAIIGRHHALFTDRVEHDFSKLSDAQLIERAKGSLPGDGAAGVEPGAKGSATASD